MSFLTFVGENTKISLIVALGNPGSKYENTRHNVGFMFVDYLLSLDEFKYFSTSKKEEYIEYSINDKNLKIIKPRLFMNNSGTVVKKYTDYSNHSSEEILIIHDDLDIELGRYKIQKGKSPKSHNGIISIEQNLDISNSMRLRIGIDNRADDFKGAGKDYVLGRFTAEETTVLKKTFQDICKNFDLNL